MSWIQTYGGTKFDPLRPHPSGVHLRDIAHALSLKCRFGGHCTRFYSVAEHSVYVAWEVLRRKQAQTRPVRGLLKDTGLKALLHDAAEAYLADIPRPVKPALQGWHTVETRVERTIFDAFGLTGDLPRLVHAVDSAVLANERRDLMVECDGWDPLPPPVVGLTIRGLSPPAAETAFIAAFKAITHAY